MSSIRRQSGTTRRSSKAGWTPRQGVKSEIKKMLASTLERKHIDTYVDSSTTYPLMSAPTITQLNVISQGNSESTRIGNKINYKSFTGRFHVVVQSPVDNTDNVISTRVVILMWKPNSTPTAGQIFQSVSTATKALLSPFNHEYKKQFMVLYDSGIVDVYPIYGNNGAGTPAKQNTGMEMHFNIPLIVKPLTGLSADYNGSSTTDSSNRIYIVYGADIAAKLDIEGWARVSYTDA